jgi:hypothetical protein
MEVIQECQRASSALVGEKMYGDDGMLSCEHLGRSWAEARRWVVVIAKLSCEHQWRKSTLSWQSDTIRIVFIPEHMCSPNENLSLTSTNSDLPLIFTINLPCARPSTGCRVRSKADIFSQSTRLNRNLTAWLCPPRPAESITRDMRSTTHTKI